MLPFRIYGLDPHGHIVTQNYATSDDLPGAIWEGWRFIAARAAQGERASHLEVWNGGRLLFSSGDQAWLSLYATLLETYTVSAIS